MEKTDDAMDLTRAYNKILKISRQVPRTERGDAHRIEYLLRAGIVADWFREPISRVGNNGLSFQKLYGELEDAVKPEKESKPETIRAKSNTS